LPPRRPRAAAAATGAAATYAPSARLSISAPSATPATSVSTIVMLGSFESEPAPLDEVEGGGDASLGEEDAATKGGTVAGDGEAAARPARSGACAEAEGNAEADGAADGIGPFAFVYLPTTFMFFAGPPAMVDVQKGADVTACVYVAATHVPEPDVVTTVSTGLSSLEMDA